jgi:hypothetical protein
MRLDRDAAPGNAAWDELRRGDVFVTERALLASKPRVGKDSVMTLAGETESR